MNNSKRKDKEETVRLREALLTLESSTVCPCHAIPRVGEGIAWHGQGKDFPYLLEASLTGFKKEGREVVP